MVVHSGPCKVAATEMVEFRRMRGGSANSTIPAKEQCWVDFDAMVFDRGKNEKKVNCEKMERRKGERKYGW